LFNLHTIALFILLASPALCLAQHHPSFWSVDGSLRYRFEKYEGYNAKNYGDNSPAALGQLEDALLLQRLIFGLSGLAGNHIVFALHLQDSRAFGWSLRNSKEPEAFSIGDKSGVHYYRMNPQEEFFEIYDAAVQVGRMLPNIDFILGRQKIFCTDYRIFGPGEWGNTGRWTWDAVRLKWHKNGASVDTWAGGTKIHDPQKTFIPFTHTEFWGAGLYGSYQTRAATIDAYCAVKKPGSAEYIKEQNFKRYWIGLRLDHQDSSGAIYEVNYARGFGKQNQRTIKSSGLFIKIGWASTGWLWQPVLSLRYSYASGDDPKTTVIETFDPVYGAGDKYYGWMNLVQWSNLDDREIMLELSPGRNARIELKYNQFFIPYPGAPINGTLVLPQGRHYLGNELDLFIKGALSKTLQFTTAFSWFSPKEARLTGGAILHDAFWWGLQMEYKFRYTVNSKNK
jgi:hypothetical protein